MPNKTLRGARNYAGTFILLAGDLLRFQGLRAFYLLPSVALAGFLMPVPFAILGGAIYAIMGGKDHFSVTFSGERIPIHVDHAFLIGIGMAILALSVRFLAMRAMLAVTTQWQTSLFWRAVNRLPTLARWTSESALPLPLTQRYAQTLLTRIVRSGFLLGRIMAIGLQDLLLIIGALCLLAWIDVVSVLILVGLGLVSMPLYFVTLSQLLKLRTQSGLLRRERSKILQAVVEDGILDSPGQRVDSVRLQRDERQFFESGYGLVNALLLRLNLVNFFVGLQVFLSIGAIYIWQGGDLTAFVGEKLFFLVVLLFMMKSALSLMTLLSRITRGYGNLALLRAYFNPSRKQPLKVSAPNAARFKLDGTRDRAWLQTGEPVFALVPGAKHGFELICLSNALRFADPPDEREMRFIPLIDESALEAILEGRIVPAESVQDFKHGDVSISLPMRSEGFELDRYPVIALSSKAWSVLNEKHKAEELCEGRTVFVVLADLERPRPLPRGAKLIVTDSTEVMGYGPFAETSKKYGEQALRRAGRKSRSHSGDAMDEDEEM